MPRLEDLLEIARQLPGCQAYAALVLRDVPSASISHGFSSPNAYLRAHASTMVIVDSLIRSRQRSISEHSSSERRAAGQGSTLTAAAQPLAPARDALRYDVLHYDVLRYDALSCRAERELGPIAAALRIPLGELLRSPELNASSFAERHRRKVQDARYARRLAQAQGAWRKIADRYPSLEASLRGGAGECSFGADM